MQTRKKGIDYVRTRQEQAIAKTPELSLSVLRVQDKIEKASVTSMLRGALSTNRLQDITLAEA